MTIQATAIVVWALRIIAALIMLQTLFFKFTGAEESIYIFSLLGMEPWGRIATGILELIASILILYPPSTFLGAALGTGLMAGAIGVHLTSLGITVREDGGQLFIYAVVAFICSLALVVIHRNDLFQFTKRFPGKNNSR